MFKISSLKTFLSAVFQLEGSRYNLSATQPVVSCKRESSNVLLSLSASVRAACLAKPPSRTGSRNLLMTSMYGSDLSLKNSTKTHVSPSYNLSDRTVSAPTSACEKASSRVISLAGV